MATYAMLLSGLALLAAAPAAQPPAGPVVLACRIPVRAASGSGAVTSADRIFRVGPGAFQEWDANQRKFGRNLCDAFPCSKTPDRMEGNVSSASASYTVGIMSNTGEGYWRAVGATGFAAKQGVCRVITEPKS